MRPLAAHMGIYAAYHRHPTNRMIHFIMVPAIVWSLMLIADLVPLVTLGGVNVTLAIPITAAVLIWYLMLDFPLGVVAVAIFTMLLVSAMWVNETLGSTRSSLIVFAAVFVGSWIFQILGHSMWEKRRPALADNFLQVFVAPIFLVAETAFAWGFRKDLQAKVESVMQDHLPGAPA